MIKLGPRKKCDLEKVYPRMDFIAKLRRLTDALESEKAFAIKVAGERLQMKMVCRVGKSYEHKLGRGDITQVLAAAGLDLTSQVLEGYAHKLLSGLLGKFGGGLVRGAGQQVASSSMSFAITWAIGKLAKQYYAAARKLSAIGLREMFGALKEQARSLHSRYAGDIQQKASSVSLSQFLPGQVTIVGVILLTTMVNLLIGSASAKWALLGPIFVPMLMQLGLSPELTQAAYRIGDSSTNIVTPLIVVYCQRYVKSTGIGTLVATMLPYSVLFLVTWTILLLIYWALGLPLGLQASYVHP